MTEMSEENAVLGIGEVLLKAREAKQQPLTDISALLKIREDHLQALEDENFAVLPGDAYAIGFIRTYANHLGLNSAELVTRFKESREKPQFDETSFEPDAEVEPMSALLKVGIGVAAVFVVYLAWLVSVGPVQKETNLARSNVNDDSATPQAKGSVVVAPQAVSPPRPAQPALQAIVPEPTKKPAQKPAVEPASPDHRRQKWPNRPLRKRHLHPHQPAIAFDAVRPWTACRRKFRARCRRRQMKRPVLSLKLILPVKGLKFAPNGALGCGLKMTRDGFCFPALSARRQFCPAR